MEDTHERPTPPKSPEQLQHDRRVNGLASQFHDMWRVKRAMGGGYYEPQMMRSEDLDWVSAYGIAQVDIANTPYQHLPPDIQEGSKRMAEKIMTEVEATAKLKRVFDEEFFDEVNGKLQLQGQVGQDYRELISRAINVFENSSPDKPKGILSKILPFLKGALGKGLDKKSTNLDDQSPKMDRRSLLKAAAGGATLVAMSSAHVISNISSADSDSQVSKDSGGLPKPPEKTKPIYNSGLEALMNEGMQHKKLIIERAKVFMAMEQNTSGRIEKELELMNFLKTQLELDKASAADVLFALKAVITYKSRDMAMSMIWQIRQAGKLEQFGCHKLNEAHIKYAMKHGIDPGMLAIAMDVYPATYDLLNHGGFKFYEAVDVDEPNARKIQDRIPSPGALARLMQYETAGYRHIGDASAVKEVNQAPEWFPSASADLKEIAKHHEETTGLPYQVNWNLIPGSLRGDTSVNASGGAIGPQFMPFNARYFIKNYIDANRRTDPNYPDLKDKNLADPKYPDVNLFDPFTGTILSFMYVSAEWYARHDNIDKFDKSIVRTGWSSDLVDKRAALKKWNPYQPEIDAVMHADEDWIKMFGVNNRPTGFA